MALMAAWATDAMKASPGAKPSVAMPQTCSSAADQYRPREEHVQAMQQPCGCIWEARDA